MPAKKQHYVPKALLKRFADGAGASARTNVYDIERSSYRARQNIRDICSANYLYDTDDSFEKFLSVHVESPAATDLERLALAAEPAESRPTPNLLRFLMVQLLRTRLAYESSLAFVNAGMQTMFAELARLNGLDVNTASNCRISPSEPRALLAYQTMQAAIRWPLISDLRMALVVNDTAAEFILSDHPVFQHNWYLRDSTARNATSIAARGAQFFLPITPAVTLCLYDPSVYLYGDATSGKLARATEDDVQILNSFQAINAKALLLARSPTMASVLSTLGIKHANSRAFTETGTHSPATVRPDGTLRSLHVSQRRQIPLPSMPSFVKIKNKVRRKPVRSAERSPELVRALEDYVERLRSGDPMTPPNDTI